VVDALKSGDDPIHAAYGDSERLLARVLLHSLEGMPPAAVSMFLDVACVLHGQPVAAAKAFWQGLWPEQFENCFRLLLTRNLLTVQIQGAQMYSIREWYGKLSSVPEALKVPKMEVLEIHDVLKWLGRSVVRGESGAAQLQEHVGSRLWVQDGSMVGAPCEQVRTLVALLQPLLPTLAGPALWTARQLMTYVAYVCRAAAPPPSWERH
jgi:hypothetical protein